MAEKIKNFQQLRIWKYGIELVKAIYKVTGNFPKSEVYSLTSQMRRSAISIPSNIAEGFKRRHGKEFKQFLNITLGSLAELDTQIIIAFELNYIAANIKDEIREKIDYLSRMTYILHGKI